MKAPTQEVLFADTLGSQGMSIKDMEVQVQLESDQTGKELSATQHAVHAMMLHEHELAVRAEAAVQLSAYEQSLCTSLETAVRRVLDAKCAAQDEYACVNTSLREKIETLSTLMQAVERHKDSLMVMLHDLNCLFLPEYCVTFKHSPAYQAWELGRDDMYNAVMSL